MPWRGRFGFLDKAMPYIGATALVLGISYGAYYQHQSAGYAATAAAFGKLDHTLLKTLNTSQNNHHAETSSQNKAILKVLNEHTTTLEQSAASAAAVEELQKEFTQFVAQATPALESGQQDLLSQIEALGNKISALCTATPGANCG